MAKSYPVVGERRNAYGKHAAPDMRGLPGFTVAQNKANTVAGPARDVSLPKPCMPNVRTTTSRRPDQPNGKAATPKV